MKIAAAVSALLLAVAAGAAVKEEPVKTGIALKPGESSRVELGSETPVELSWTAVQPKRCATNCLEMTDKSGGYEAKVAASIGAGMTATPVKGRIVLEFANRGDFPIEVTVARVVRTCDAQACAFLHGDLKARWLVFKIDRFTAIKTSADASYSTISGVTTSGKAFTLKAVWWTDDPRTPFSCRTFIQKYLDQGTPKEKYSPYILSGQALDGEALVLKSVDTCTPNAPHFGVPEQTVYK